MSPGYWVLGGLGLLFLVGTVGHLVPTLLPLMLPLTPWFLFVAGAGVLLFTLITSDRRGALGWWLATYLVVTFGLEVLGVATGLVFGAYRYTEILGPLVWGVPPVIGWNWVLVILGIHAAVQGFWGRLPEGVQVLVVGVGCLAFDLFLEPVATGLGYWVWTGGAVPLQNYLAWAVIGCLGSWWAHRVRILGPTSPLPGVAAGYVALQLVFFAVLNLGGLHR